MSAELLSRIRIVLSHTSHPGNIGAAARAMKTMGITSLYLVNPKKPIDAEAEAMASGAVGRAARRPHLRHPGRGACTARCTRWR